MISFIIFQKTKNILKKRKIEVKKSVCLEFFDHEIKITIDGQNDRTIEKKEVAELGGIAEKLDNIKMVVITPNITTITYKDGKKQTF